ncbi:MAG TPA: hypothetical protein VKB96_12540, partial [Gammaproteobacteria bacterium]|nr:hypothetical protein [Gammaproteobacteria bacterium]
HAKTYQARDLVLSEWEQNIHRFPSAAKAGIHFADWLGERNYKFEPRTVTGWILKRAKEKGVKFR